MAIRFQIGGVSTVIPGVYDSFRVAPSLAGIAPSGRSILLIGEAEEGAPGSELDLRFNFFTDYESLKDFYKSGSICDGARELFSSQPSQVFAGAVQRVFVYKTNASTRAERSILAPSNFGKLVAARFGEAGNLIKTQILQAQAESKPSKTFLYLPSPVSRSLKASVDGAVSSALTLTADQAADSLVTALNTVSGLSATGGTARATSVLLGTLTIDITASGDLLTLTSTGPGGFSTDAQAGDSAYILTGTPLAGASDENAGAYIVTSWSNSSVTLKQLKRAVPAGETNVSMFFFTGTGVTLPVGDWLVNAPVTATVTATTATGSGATLELLGLAGDAFALGNLVRDADLASIISAATSSVASISATVPSAGKLKLSITGGSFSTTPKAGDLIRIPRGSVISGPTASNVGLMVVESASAQSITAAHLYSGMTTQAVASQSLGGNPAAFSHAASFVSNDRAARRIDSSAERKVKLDASRSSDGASLPLSMIGGSIALELSYWHSAATAATVSIDQQKQLTITPTGTGLTPVVVKLNKYKDLQSLIDFLNTQANISARIPDNRFKSLAPSVLDMVTSVGILSGHSLHAHSGRIKKDYSDWKQFFEDNFSLLAFAEGSLTLKAGLPDTEASATFLSGAAIGATSDSDVQKALDEALKIDVRMVVPAFSRDASLDIEDGLTDSSSSYSIDAINAATKGHAATASSSLFKKERFGLISWDGSFAEAKQKVGEIAFERCSMTFQRVMATSSDGTLQPFLPWMAQCALAAGRAQSALGTSMLRKPFLLSDVKHIGQQSLYSDTLTQDFNPDDRGQLEEGISAGLLCLRAVSGFGVRLESPDLSSRSRENDPEGWVWERQNVLFVCDEVRQTIRSVLENFIGNRTSDTPVAVVKTAIENTLSSFLGSSLLAGKVVSIQSLGNQYKAAVSITPVEALEAIVLDVSAERSTT